MVNEGKAALAALTGYVLLCLEAAIILNATVAHFKGRDVLGAVFFGPDVDIVLPFALATAVLAVPIFLLFRAIFFVFQLTTWVAFAFAGGVAAMAAMLLLGGVREAPAFALAGIVAGNLYREGEARFMARRRMAENA
ncbi:MAG: hypothetical protein LW703_04875 [Rhodobacter sp.]|nr:hypothetical protein [Rhodobacter sp.]